jgi:hypothetical protein
MAGQFKTVANLKTNEIKIKLILNISYPINNKKKLLFNIIRIKNIKLLQF